tara:strand:- start:281 stop:643 length:363 start_codon:yes stop_codon:yes gene_type:complete
MTETEGMKNYGADLTNARANAGAIVLYTHEELSLMKAMEGLQALRSARKAFLLVNPDHEKYFPPLSGTVYDEHEINAMIDLVETQLILCRQRIENMKESFNDFTGLTWAEKQERHGTKED